MEQGPKKLEDSNSRKAQVASVLEQFVVDEMRARLQPLSKDLLSLDNLTAVLNARISRIKSRMDNFAAEDSDEDNDDESGFLVWVLFEYVHLDGSYEFMSVHRSRRKAEKAYTSTYGFVCVPYRMHSNGDRKHVYVYAHSGCDITITNHVNDFMSQALILPNRFNGITTLTDANDHLYQIL
jgi:hypothetical protein